MATGAPCQTSQVTGMAQSVLAEVARMLGGVKITNQTLAHAKEMITGA